MPDEVFRMVDMERKLADDRNGSYRDQVCRELAEERAALKRRADAGLSPDEFASASRVLAAYDSAERVIRTLWSTAHGR